MRGFREALRLPGWSEQSIWGYDENIGTYFAQLWRDEDRNDEPTIWISGCDPIASGLELAAHIASATGVDVESAMRAMHIDSSVT
ncbi:MAG: hypothetical protein LH645_13210 [Actinomycetia bacterium]|nr:hypothetical protein [Actinomycetes bacterium]